MSRHALVKDGKIIEFRDYAPNVDQSMLAEGKPRMLPVVSENEKYDPQTHVRTGPEYIVHPKQVIERYTLREKRADEIAEMKIRKSGEIKDEAERRILEIMPDHKQRNTLALGMEMVTTYGADPAKWPDDMRTIYYGVMKQWEQIKGLRAASNTKESEVVALDAAKAIADYDISAGWD